MRDGEGLPRFVEQEFRDFLRCGWLAGGFARFRCEACGLDRLVAFSCTGRGCCPSCGGRRMAERAAHLVDHVFPDVPVRQAGAPAARVLRGGVEWVLSLPPRLRYRLAWDHALCRAVVAVLLRAVFRHLRTLARERGVTDSRGGAVAVVQRVGGALNLNVHVQALVLDGVFARGAAGPITCHPLPDLTAADVADVRAAIAPGVARLLTRRGLSEDDSVGAPDAWAEEAPELAGLAAASVKGGGGARQPGGRPRAAARRAGRGGDEAPGLGRCHARQHGFDLHAGLVVPAGQRERLERVCRYVLRPPVAQERLSLTGTGQVVPRAASPDPVAPVARDAESGPADTSAGTRARCSRGRLWAELMRRTFGFDAGVPAARAVRGGVGRAGVSAVWRSSAAHCPHRPGRGDSADSAAPRRAGRGPRAQAVPRAAAVRQRLRGPHRRRHRRLRPLRATSEFARARRRCARRRSRSGPDRALRSQTAAPGAIIGPHVPGRQQSAPSQ